MHRISLILILGFMALSSCLLRRNAVCPGFNAKIETTPEEHQQWIMKVSDTTKTIVKGFVEDNLPSKNGEGRPLPYTDIKFIRGIDTLKAYADYDGKFYFIACEAGIYKIIYVFIDTLVEDIELRKGYLAQVKVKFDFHNHVDHKVSVTYLDYDQIDFENLYNY
ncbi:MAG: hypothetical protein EYC69_05415 [Bacteroidetes bacterium]|nr:MAG: hypothetical protein EYC69_05415 [Bacteroidota bacterium]